MWFDGEDDDKKDTPKPDEGGPEAGQYNTEVHVPGKEDALDNSQL